MQRLMLAGCVAAFALSACAVTFTVDSVKQRYPWNGLVDIDYTVAYEAGESALDPSSTRLEAVASDLGANPVLTVRMASFDMLPLPLAAGTHRVTWNAKADGMAAVSDNVQVQFSLVRPCTNPKYLVIDLSGGPMSDRYPVVFLDAEPTGGFNTDEYKTRKIVFKLVPPGCFVMGTPDGEPVRQVANERQHAVVLTKPYYLALFELTLGQYRNFAVKQPNHHNTMDARQPLNTVSMDTFRGKAVATPAAATPLAVLRAKTGLAIDLPTEAQWEYACRAGTTTPFSDGVACATAADLEARMRLLGRFIKNIDDAQGVFTTSVANNEISVALVGSYSPNPWGFYDMHGGVWEATRDRWVADPGATGSALDPCYGGSSSSPVAKGGSFATQADRCRSGARTDLNTANGYHYSGYRLALTLEN